MAQILGGEPDPGKEALLLAPDLLLVQLHLAFRLALGEVELAFGRLGGGDVRVEFLEAAVNRTELGQRRKVAAAIEQAVDAGVEGLKLEQVLEAAHLLHGRLPDCGGAQATWRAWRRCRLRPPAASSAHQRGSPWVPISSPSPPTS